MEASNQQQAGDPKPMSQLELDEMQEQIRLNEEYSNKIREEIEASTPFISELTSIEVVKAEYADNFKFGECF